MCLTAKGDEMRHTQRKRSSHLEDWWPYYLILIFFVLIGLLSFHYDTQCAAAGWPDWAMTMDGVYCKNLMEAVPLRDVITR
jgi:hypothetical protein